MSAQKHLRDIHEETPKRKKPASAKKKVVDDEPGMKLPIVYPAELSGVNTEALSTFEDEVEEGVC